MGSAIKYTSQHGKQSWLALMANREELSILQPLNNGLDLPPPSFDTAEGEQKVGDIWLGFLYPRTGKEEGHQKGPLSL